MEDKDELTVESILEAVRSSKLDGGYVDNQFLPIYIETVVTGKVSPHSRPDIPSDLPEMRYMTPIVDKATGMLSSLKGFGVDEKKDLNKGLQEIFADEIEKFEAKTAKSASPTR